MSNGTLWPEEVVDALPAMIEAGLPPREIRAKIFEDYGVVITRNSLASKLHRMKLKAADGRPTEIRANGTRRGVNAPPPWTMTQASNSVANIPDDESDSYAKYHWTCRYPMNDDMRNPEWCGSDRRKNSPYCHAHHALCHKPVETEKNSDAE